MRIVITGGSGFIGSHLCDRYLAAGHVVLALDNFCTGSPDNTKHLRRHPLFSLMECDVSEGLPVEGEVDRVLHLASPANPKGYQEIPLATLKAGSLATFHCAELARKTGARLLLASTSEVYGDPLEHPQRESYWGHVNPVGVRSVYDEAKRFSESVLMAYHRQYGMETRIARIFNTYGPRMLPDDGRVLPEFFKQALQGNPLTIYGDGSRTRSFCYVSDLVEGLMRLLESDTPEPVNLGNPVEISMEELAHEVLELTGSRSTLQYMPARDDDPQRRCPDITLARRLLGWEPQVPRAAGLLATYQYFQETTSAPGLMP